MRYCAKFVAEITDMLRCRGWVLMLCFRLWPAQVFQEELAQQHICEAHSCQAAWSLACQMSIITSQHDEHRPLLPLPCEQNFQGLVVVVHSSVHSRAMQSYPWLALPLGSHAAHPSFMCVWQVTAM